MDRITRELELLRSQYGLVDCGEAMDWILVREFPLPVGWNRERTEVLVIIPAGYPTTPPDNFYVPEGLRLADGQGPNNYSEGQNVIGRTWAQFSFHAESWRPSGDLYDGDNLLSFLIAARRRLGEGA